MSELLFVGQWQQQQCVGRKCCEQQIQQGASESRPASLLYVNGILRSICLNCLHLTLPEYSGPREIAIEVITENDLRGGVGGGVIMHWRMLKEEVRVGEEGCVGECGSDVEDSAAATLHRDLQQSL